jgi:hypothetical protein
VARRLERRIRRADERRGHDFEKAILDSALSGRSEPREFRRPWRGLLHGVLPVGTHPARPPPEQLELPEFIEAEIDEPIDEPAFDC